MNILSIRVSILRKSIQKRRLALHKLYIQIFTSFIFIYSPLFIQGSIDLVSYTQPDTPSYAKWGKLAMQETKQKYPDAEIVDYLHRGRHKKGDAMIEQFKLWLRGENKEFGVYVNIEFDSTTEKVLHITFIETDS